MKFLAFLFFSFLLNSASDHSISESERTPIIMMCSGNGIVIASNDVPDAANASGVPDGNYASLYQGGDAITLDLGAPLTAPTIITVTYEKISGSGTDPTFNIFSSASAGSGFTQVAESPITITTGTGVVATFMVTVPTGDQYIEIESINGIDVGIDAIEFSSLPFVTAAAVQPSCIANVPQSDGYLNIIEALNATSYHWSLGSTFDDNGGANTFANATSLAGATYPLQVATGQPNPTGMQDYTIRVYSTADCFTDVILTMNERDCTVSCNCTEMVYLNEPSNGGSIHKYIVNPDGTFTEIGSPWYDNNAANEDVDSPHGLATDNLGFIYVGESATGGEIRKLNCNGEILPESSFAISNGGQTNIVTVDGQYLYANDWNSDEWKKWDLCIQQQISTVSTCEATDYNWGLYYDENSGLFYATSDFGGDDPFLYVFTDADFDNDPNTCIDGIPLPQFGNDFSVAGVTTDADGFVYIVVHEGSGDDSFIAKYSPSPNFNYLGMSAIDDDDDGTGFNEAIGIVYSETLNQLFVSTRASNDDCISTFDTNLNYLGQTVPAPGGGARAKGIAITKECCPINNNMVIDTAFCNSNIGDVINLTEIIACNGVVCEGIWSEQAGNTGLVYDDCLNTASVTIQEGCGSYLLESDGTNPNSYCGAFSIEINIVVIPLTGPVIAGDQTICGAEAPAAFTITTPASSNATLSYQWQKSTMSCSEGFSDIMGATAVTYDEAPGISQTTYYRLITRATEPTCPNGMCMEISNCVTLTVLPNPTCIISIDLTAPVSNQDLPATGPAGIAAYQWSIISGDATIDGATNVQNILVDLGSLQSTLQLVVTDANGCMETCTVLLPTGCPDPSCYGIQITRN